MSNEKFTPEEVSELTGEDIEDLRDEQHPTGSLDDDNEGTGVNEPDIDSASWDDEIEGEDKNDIHLRGMDFKKLTPEDRNFYLEMVSLRRQYEEQGASKNLERAIDDIAKRIRGAQAQSKGVKERELFLAMINNKLAGVSLQMQVDNLERKTEK